MSESPCYGHFGDNFDNPNCDICHVRLDCYEKWNHKDKIKQTIKDEQAKPWSKRRPLAKIFPELCSRCERDEE